MATAVEIKNLPEFNLALEKFAKSIPAELIPTLQRKIGLEALRRIVLKTPVDTGRARGNWQTTINRSVESEHWQTDPIEAGTATLAGEIPPYAVVYLTNNVIYILPLEHGHSKQAPYGMVGLTLEELRLMFP